VVVRWTNYLELARTLAEFLAENGSGRNYRVPPEGRPRRVLRLHAAGREHSKPDASYWLDDETPRVCVPQEPIEYVTAGKAAAPRLVSRPPSEPIGEPDCESAVSHKRKAQ
jgi:hypothetical protein